MTSSLELASAGFCGWGYAAGEAKPITKPVVLELKTSPRDYHDLSMSKA